MTSNHFEINIDGERRTINVNETASREIEVDGRFYIVPAAVVNLLREAAAEIETQQKRKIATDKQIDEKIAGRVDRILKALAGRGMLSDQLTAEYKLPPGVETAGGTTWTFQQEARGVCLSGLKNEFGDELADDIGSPYTKPHRK